MSLTNSCACAHACWGILLCSLSNHEKSKRHKENAVFLKLVMEEDEAREKRRERKREDKEELSELRNLSSSDSSRSLNEVDSPVDDPSIKKESTELPSTATYLGGQVDDKVDGPLDDTTEEEDGDDDVVDFGVFGRRKTDVRDPIVDMLVDKQVNCNKICYRLGGLIC